MSTTIPNIPDNCYYDGTAIPTNTVQSMSPEPEPQITLQSKSETIQTNTTTTITPDDGYVGLSSVSITTQVPQTVKNKINIISMDIHYINTDSESIYDVISMGALRFNQSQTSFEAYCFYVFEHAFTNSYDIYFVEPNKIIPSNVYYITFNDVSISYISRICLNSIMETSTKFDIKMTPHDSIFFKLELSLDNYQLNLPTQP